jgi:hypothetical protein
MTGMPCLCMHDCMAGWLMATAPTLLAMALAEDLMQASILESWLALCVSSCFWWCRSSARFSASVAFTSRSRHLRAWGGWLAQPHE